MTEVINIYKEFLGFFPPHIGILLNLLILTILIVIYSVIIWKFYRILAKKNTINLNLNKYNTTQNSFLSRLFTGALYFLENLVIAPILIFIAFVVFTFFLIILSQTQEIPQILIISAVVTPFLLKISFKKTQ